MYNGQSQFHCQKKKKEIKGNIVLILNKRLAKRLFLKDTMIIKSWRELLISCKCTVIVLNFS